MTTLRQSSNVNMDGWEPVTPQTQPQPRSAPVDPRTLRNPQMLAPMPLLASSLDALSRQFYGGPNLPTYRILPPSSKRGGA
jgi:hypothetical protein